jgi:hypothetical protein
MVAAATRQRTRLEAQLWKQCACTGNRVLTRVSVHAGQFLCSLGGRHRVA